MLGEMAACTTVSLHMYQLPYMSVQRYLPFWQLHSNLWISVMELVMS